MIKLFQATLAGGLCFAAMTEAEPLKVDSIYVDTEIQGLLDLIGEHTKLQQYSEPCGFQFARSGHELMQVLKGALYVRGVPTDQVDGFIFLMIPPAKNIEDRFRRQAQQDKANGTLQATCKVLQEQNVESGLLVE